VPATQKVLTMFERPQPELQSLVRWQRLLAALRLSRLQQKAHV